MFELIVGEVRMSAVPVNAPSPLAGEGMEDSAASSVG